MTEYYPVLVKTVAQLGEDNTPERRREVYEHARNVMEALVHASDPPASEEEIAQERALFEDACQKIESEQVLRARLLSATDVPEHPKTLWDASPDLWDVSKDLWDTSTPDASPLAAAPLVPTPLVPPPLVATPFVATSTLTPSPVSPFSVATEGDEAPEVSSPIAAAAPAVLSTGAPVAVASLEYDFDQLQQRLRDHADAADPAPLAAKPAATKPAAAKPVRPPKEAATGGAFGGVFGKGGFGGVSGRTWRITVLAALIIGAAADAGAKLAPTPLVLCGISVAVAVACALLLTRRLRFGWIAIFPGAAAISLALVFGALGFAQKWFVAPDGLTAKFVPGAAVVQSLAGRSLAARSRVAPTAVAAEGGVPAEGQDQSGSVAAQPDATVPNPIVTQLLAKSTAPVQAGADQAVGDAVEAITLGAQDGDEHLTQALAHLKSNRTADAVQALAAVTADWAIKVRQDSKDAAAAYRNLGAIARLSDPKQALDAYEKAIELDPEDIESMFRAGDILIDRGNLDAAKARLDRVLAAAGTDQAFYRFWASLRLGDIRERRGDVAGASKLFRDAADAGNRMVGAEPDNPTRQSDLSASFERIGNVQIAQGDLAGALKSYRGSLEIRDRLAKDYPENMAWQRDLSTLLVRTGDVLVAQRDFAGALKSYQDGFIIHDALTRLDTSNVVWQRDLSVSLEKIGNVEFQQGDRAGALKSYRDSLAIRQALVKSDPKNAGWQRDLSVSLEKIGNVLIDQDAPGALKSYRDSFAIFDRLAKLDPTSVAAQRSLSVSYAKLAGALRKTGDNPKALEALRQGRAIMARMTSLSPENATWKSDLAWFDSQIQEVSK